MAQTKGWRTLVVTVLILSLPVSADAKHLLVYPPGDKGHPSAGNSLTTIAAGLAAVESGDTLQIMPGEYNHDHEAPYVENIIVDSDRVTLQSDNVIEDCVFGRGPIETITCVKPM